ncbi:MAG: hypothetical protein Kow0092_20060 [Deferrisomatales bacterium]
MVDPKRPAPGEPEPSTAEPGAAEPAVPPSAAEPAEEATTEAFAELLAEAGEQPQLRWKKGEKVKGRVARVTDEWIFVELGGKEEGALRAEEFGASGEEGAPPPLPAEGDEVEAYVLSTDGGEVILTTKLGRREASLAALEQAYRSGIPVEGRVVKVIKGGYEVRVSGTRAFCPSSQIDVRWAKTPEVHVNQTYTFKVLEFKEKGRNVIVSRRALIEEERARKREELKETVVPGAVVTGVVRSIQSFGAFVDLGGVDALIPISEASWGRVDNLAEVLQEGQTVTAKVLAVDWERDRISLSLKALEADPWERVAETYKPGQRVRGTVARLAKFGAFVTLEPGVDGLVHISALGAGRRVGHPKEVVQPGQEVEVEITAVDPENHKISLSMEHRFYESLGDLPGPGEVVTGTVEKVADFGVFVKLPSGHTGLVPNVEMGTPKGTDHSRMFRPGDSVEVQVLSVEEAGRRIRLSRRSVAEGREAQAAAEYQQRQGSEMGGMGTLGDLFKDKLRKRR